MRKLVLAALAAFLCLFADSADSSAQAINVGNWSVNNTPAVNTQASASKAASTIGRTHVATSCSGSINTVVAQPGITLAVRDGASGAGTVLWSATIACAISTPCVLTSPLLNLVGSSNTAMTCEFSGIPGVGNFETVTLTGFDTGS